MSDPATPKASNRTHTVCVLSVHSPYAPFSAVQYDIFRKPYGSVQEIRKPYTLIVRYFVDVEINPKLRLRIVC